jgi:hypothetical protein
MPLRPHTYWTCAARRGEEYLDRAKEREEEQESAQQGEDVVLNDTQADTYFEITTPCLCSCTFRTGVLPSDKLRPCM